MRAVFFAAVFPRFARDFAPRAAGAAFLPPALDDADAAVSNVQALGGSVVQAAEDTPYGRLATVADPSGAQFKFRQSNG